MRSQDTDPAGKADRQQFASIKELRAAGKPLLESDIDWLVGEVERLREECEGLRESIMGWRHSYDVVSGEAQRARGLEGAARSAFAEVERLRKERSPMSPSRLLLRPEDVTVVQDEDGQVIGYICGTSP